MSRSDPGSAWQPTESLPDLGPDDVHVWRFGLDLPESELAELRRWLSEEERARAARYRMEQVRRRFEAGRGRMRVLLAGYLGQRPDGLRFSYGSQGKPSVVDSGGLEFNLSHSKGRALLAVARRTVGVDLETLREGLDGDRLADRFFAPEEREALRSVPPEERRRRFFILWVRKEAFLKATGRGLAGALDRFSILDAPDGTGLWLSSLDHPEQADDWSFRDLDPGGEAVSAIAVAGSGWRLSCWEPGVSL